MASSFQNPKLIVALDFPTRNACIHLVEQLDPKLCRLKIGKEMFTRYGPALVEDLQKKGFDIFLDLKFHDIPSTVGKAVAAAASLSVWMVNVHASGGRRMLETAKDALSQVERAPLLIAVTVLTSMDSSDLAEIGVDSEPQAQVVRLAGLAKDTELDGVVCSALEASNIKQRYGNNFLCITPGIRPVGGEVADQRRVVTPEFALSKGSDYLVIGRPVTQAADPRSSLIQIVDAIEHF